MFQRLFGRGKQAKPLEKSSDSGHGKRGTTQSLEKIDSALELLEKREDVIEKKIATELSRAKEFHAKKNTQSALQCMRRKKALEEQLLSIAAQKQNLDTVKLTIQNQSMHNAVLEAQIQAKKELKESNKRMNADKIEDTMENLVEEMDKANSVAEMLRQPLDGQVVDEEDLLAELMAETEAEAETAPEPVHTGALPSMPVVPSGALAQPAKTKKADDEEAMRELEAELFS